MPLHCVCRLAVKKADRAIDLALTEWNKKTPNQNKAGSMNAAQHKNSSMNVICGKSWITK